MPTLKNNPTLSDIQEYVKELEIERGFQDYSILQECLLLGEEVGELYKAIRKENKLLKVDHNSKFSSASEEFADVIIVLSAIANRLGIDLEQAFRDKEEINKKRSWK